MDDGKEKDRIVEVINSVQLEMCDIAKSVIAKHC